jgi:hypothetical protein
MRIHKTILKRLFIITFGVAVVLLLAVPVKAAVGEWSSNGSTIYYNEGRIGVGTSTPEQLIEVNSMSTSNSAAIRYHIPYLSHFVTGIDKADGKFKINYDKDFSVGLNLVTVEKNGEVGIGTSDPRQLLEIQNKGGDAAVRYHAYNISHFTAGVDASDGAYKVNYGQSLDSSPRLEIKKTGEVCIGNC